MIISVAKLKEFITTDVSDSVLQARLEALETSIRNKTHNNFQDRRFRTTGNVSGNTVECLESGFFNVGDTIMVNNDLVVVSSISDDTLTISETLMDSKDALVTKIVYPKDIQLGVVDVMTWILSNPSSKAGISSETLSRHSVTYQGNAEFDSDIGCPIRLLSFLNQYKKARF